MKEKILKILEKVQKDIKRVPSFAYNTLPEIRDKAAEEIMGEINKVCCMYCINHDRHFCTYHRINIPDSEILKCNDFTEMEGK